MPSPTVCAVSGTLRDTSGSLISGATVKATSLKPYIHPTDNSMVMDYQVTATTDSNGNWSLNLVETTTPNTTLTLSFMYYTGATSPQVLKEYTIQVPNSASATFASLIGSQL